MYRDAYKRVFDALTERGFVLEKDKANFLGTSSQTWNNWRSRGISKDAVESVAERMHWTVDFLIRGKRNQIEALRPRNLSISEPRRARIEALVSAIGDDTDMLAQFWRDIDQTLDRWDKWLTPRKPRAAGPGVDLPQSAPGARKGKLRGRRAA